MKVGIGLPSILPNTPGRTTLEWGRRAEQLGFSSVGTIGRLTFPALEELVALSAVAGATSRIGLLTNTLIAPARDAVELAKQAASLDLLSGGRLTLGLGVGWREDDFIVTGRPFEERGRRFEEDLDVMLQAWAGETVRGSWKPVSPRPTNGTVPILIGGTVRRTFDRVAKWGIGFTAGGAPPDEARRLFDQAREAWQAAGRSGQPRLVALAYYGWGPDARELATGYLGDYYGEGGLGMAQAIPVDADGIRETVDAYAAAGADELILNPTNNRLDQLEVVAEAALSVADAADASGTAA
jgi:alkanesulfonate monooxygenase SsuD/methylene tetrahydromethanopterin reductase-like flavin-dependent oxidoreductase (luciferase family)